MLYRKLPHRDSEPGTWLTRDEARAELATYYGDGQKALRALESLGYLETRTATYYTTDKAPQEEPNA